MDDIKSRNIEEFIDSLSGDDHEDVLNIVTCVDGLEFSMSIDDVLDYLETYHHDVYKEFMHIFTRIIKKETINKAIKRIKLLSNYKVLRAVDVYTRSGAERSTDIYKLVDFSTFQIEIFRKASNYVKGKFIYHFKIWNSEKDSYEELKSNHIKSNTFTDYKEALEKAKEEIIFADEEDYYG